MPRIVEVTIKRHTELGGSDGVPVIMQPMACNVQYSRLLIDDLGKVIMSCHLTLKSDMLARFSNRLFDLLDFFLKLDCRNFSNTALLELSYLFLAEYKR